MAKSSEPQAELVTELTKLGRREGIDTVFSTFLEMLALELSVSVSSTQRAERTKRLEELISKMSDNVKKSYDNIIAVMHKTAAHYSNEPQDIFSLIYHELNLSNKWSGQFFTASDLCQLMAEILNPAEELKVGEDGYLTIEEPSCGAGGTILGVVNELRRKGFDYHTKCLFTARDVDIRCIWMTYIQLCLYGIPAIVTHGNTLTDEEWSHWTTPNAILLLAEKEKKNTCNESQGMGSFEIPLIFTLSKILASEKKPGKVIELQFSAWKQLQDHLLYYQSLGYMDSLLYAIAEKKGELILEITSKSEMDKLMKPHCPHFDGNKFVDDKYVIPEEEMICWSQASLKAPLNEIGFKRYMELFQKYLPDAYEQHIKPHL